MQYRIIKKYWRRESTGELVPKFCIEKLQDVGWFKTRMEWVQITRETYFYTTTFTENVEFEKEDEAKAYLENIAKEIPEPECIMTVNTCAAAYALNDEAWETLERRFDALEQKVQEMMDRKESPRIIKNKKHR